eukprot:7682036-Lingulodinium_polyedra.AAC.1
MPWRERSVACPPAAVREARAPSLLLTVYIGLKPKHHPLSQRVEHMPRGNGGAGFSFHNACNTERKRHV